MGLAIIKRPTVMGKRFAVIKHHRAWRFSGTSGAKVAVTSPFISVSLKDFVRGVRTIKIRHNIQRGAATHGRQLRLSPSAHAEWLVRQALG
jgi:hypothetical protein